VVSLYYFCQAKFTRHKRVNLYNSCALPVDVFDQTSEIIQAGIFKRFHGVLIKMNPILKSGLNLE